MTDENARKWLLAATICLAPGGFILGATLAANHYRKKRARRAEPNQPYLDDFSGGSETPVDPIGSRKS